jgi:hypothetical protein
MSPCDEICDGMCDEMNPFFPGDSQGKKDADREVRRRKEEV